MVSATIMVQNPFRIMGYETDDIIPEGGMGAVAAQAGVGKTALLVQLAVNAMLRERKVLHISLKDPVKKVSLWYQELFTNIARQLGVDDIQDTWEAILPNRFIMTFTVDGFNVPKLKERLTDLRVQNIFLPQIIIIDGLKFDGDAPLIITDLKAMAEKYGMRLWFTVHVSVKEKSAIDEELAVLAPLLQTFDAVFKLQTEKEAILIQPLGGKSLTADPLFLDPATMLIKNQP